MLIFPALYTDSFLSYHCWWAYLPTFTHTWETRMSGKIFYRERQKVKDGSKTPRFRIAAVAGVDLKVYADHHRRGELKQMADAVGAELVELKGGGGKQRHKTE
jgi:hypothetical protein